MDILRLPLAIILLVSGAAMLASGLIVLWRTSMFLGRAIETDAMMVVGENGMKVFHFFTQDDRRIELAALAGTTGFEDGQRVRVLYDPVSPENAQLKRSMNWWLLPSLTAILGFVLMLMGVSHFSNAMR
jgi:hypothetical protein